MVLTAFLEAYDLQGISLTPQYIAALARQAAPSAGQAAKNFWISPRTRTSWSISEVVL